MNQCITVISHFTREEVLAALRALHPWIPDDAQMGCVNLDHGRLMGVPGNILTIEYTKQSDLVVSREE